MLHVRGLTVGESWSLYNINGVLIYRSIATTDEATLALPERGLYLIQSGNRTVKTVN